MEISSTSLNSIYGETASVRFRFGLNKVNTVSALKVDTSPLAQISTAYGLTNLSVQGSKTQYGFYKDGSLGLQANTTYQYSLQQNFSNLELTFSADLFKEGTFAENTFKNGPLSFEMDAWDQTIQAETSTKIRVVQPIRKVEDILKDITTGVREILSQRGDKNLRLVLDGEAIQALLSDEKIKGLMNELAGLICVINGLSLYGGPRQDYTLLVSGKGKPYLDIQQDQQIHVTSNRLHFKVTVTPPTDQNQKATPAAIEGESSPAAKIE